MAEALTVAVYGATGALGTEVRIGLEGASVDIDRLIPVAGVRSAGETVPWRGAQLAVVGPSEVPAGELDVAIFAAPSAVGRGEIPRLRHAGVLVIDLSAARPGDAEGGPAPLPVVWPGVATDALDHHPGGFALPCGPASTIAPLLGALIAAAVDPASVDVVELATASAFGREGAGALSKQTVGLLSYAVVDDGPFRDPLAFNVLDAAADDGAERGARFAVELGELVPSAEVTARLTTVCVPAFAGVFLTCTVRTREPVTDLEAVVAALEAHPDLRLCPDGVALRDAIEADEVLVSAPRHDADGALVFALAADPLHRIGARVAALLERVDAEDLW